MKKFKKLVAAAPVNLVGWAREELKEYADEVIFYSEQPRDDGELAERIQDADAVLVGFATQMGGGGGGVGGFQGETRQGENI